MATARRTLITAAILMLALAATASAQSLSSGQTIYVPVYSHIYHGLKAKPFMLTVTLSIRNTDPKNKLVITDVDYYDDHGTLVRTHLQKPKDLPPLATAEYIVYENDTTGGAGANFIIRWKSQKPINPPVVEAVMIGSSSQQGISFVSVGRVIKE